MTKQADSLVFSRVVWMYHDENRHPIVQSMIERTISTLSKHWTVCFLSPENVSLFLDVSSFPSNYPRLIPSHQSDWIRVCLLEKYGGWWIDSTTLISSELVLDDYMNSILAEKAELFGICHLQCPRKVIESNFLYAPKGSSVMKHWKHQMEVLHSRGQWNYIYQTFRDGVTFSQVVLVNYPYINPYLHIYVAEQIVLERLVRRQTVILTKPGRDTIFKLMFDCNWDYPCIISRSRNELNNSHYPITKYPTYLRRLIWPGSGATNDVPIEQIDKGITVRNHVRTSVISLLWLVLQIQSIILFFHMFRFPLSAHNKQHFQD